MWLGAPVWLVVPLWLGTLPCSMDLLWRASFLEVAGVPNLGFKKKLRAAATKCVFFCLPALLLALGGRTFKNTWFFDDPAGLSKKCASLCDEMKEKKENQF